VQHAKDDKLTLDKRRLKHEMELALTTLYGKIDGNVAYYKRIITQDQIKYWIFATGLESSVLRYKFIKTILFYKHTGTSRAAIIINNKL